MTFLLIKLQVETQRTKQWTSVIQASIQVPQQQSALHPVSLLAAFIMINVSKSDTREIDLREIKVSQCPMTLIRVKQ